MSETNDTSNESNSMSNESTLPVSRSTSANPLLRSGVLRPSVLGSSVLCSNVSNSSSAVGCAGDKAEIKEDEVVVNPFLKEQKDEADESGDGESSGVTVAEVDKVIDDNDDIDDRPDPLMMLRKNGMERVNMFAAAKSSIPRVDNSGFVFGQNVHERVVGENICNENNSNTETPIPVGNSNSELLFSSAIEKAATENKDSAIAANAAAAPAETETKSLTDVAREYVESRAQKRKFEEVETFTGEENEKNIVDVNCKLFAFVNSNWEERGRGSLRVNDAKNEGECSRVVFRTSGNLRLLLNTKVWAGMVAERPSQKSLRLTAMDNTGKIKIFLAMARPVDINQLHKALVERIDLRKITNPEECQGAADEKTRTKNGADLENTDIVVADIDDEEHVKAAKIAEPAPELEDGNEPSPKKAPPLIAVTVEDSKN